MAIDDIVGKIAEDAGQEAAVLLAAAEADAARVTAEASARADEAAAKVVAREAALAERDAATILANARLQARDAMLVARLELGAEVLDKAREALVALPDDEYAALLARGVAGSVKGGETVLLGSADAQRLRAILPAALAAAGAGTLQLGDAPADVERGVAVHGERTRVDVSPAAIIAERRNELLALAGAELFGPEG